MTYLPSTKRSPLSPSQPSPVGASAYASTGPTRSGCGLRGTHPLSPSPEVLRSLAKVDKCGDRQRSRDGHRINTESSLCFVSFRHVSDSMLGSWPPCQYYGGQNAIRLKSTHYIPGEDDRRWPIRFGKSTCLKNILSPRHPAFASCNSINL